MKIKVAFLFHYRNSGKPGSLREQVFKKCWQYYKTNLIDIQHDDVEFIEYNHMCSDDEVYNRAASRNVCVRKALHLKADVVVVMDADTFVKPEDIIKAIKVAYNDNSLVYPFNFYRKELPFNMVNRYLLSSWPKGGHKGLGSVYVVKPEVWFKFGGADERFKTWGVEDNITAYTAWAWGVEVKHLKEGVAFGIETNDSVRKTSLDYIKNFPIEKKYEAFYNRRIHADCEEARKELKQIIERERK